MLLKEDKTTEGIKMKEIIHDTGYKVAGFPPFIGYIVQYNNGMFYQGAYKQTGCYELARKYATEKYARKVLGLCEGEIVKLICN